MTDTVRRVLEREDPSRSIRVGPDFPVVVGGRPGECGPNPTLRTCWPPPGGVPDDSVKVQELIDALARIQSVSRALSETLDGFAVPPAAVEEIEAVVGPTPS
jgi:hypothetical protein